CEDRTKCDHARCPVHSTHGEGFCQWIGHAAKLVPPHHAGEHQGYGDVNDGAYDQTRNDPDGHVTLGIAGFLRRGGYSVESNVSKEDACRRARNSPKTVRRKRRPVARFDIERADADEKTDDGELEEYHR